MKIRHYALIALCFSATTPICANAQNDVWDYFESQAKKIKAPDSLTNNSEILKLSDEELEKRKEENAALSSELGISVPETFDQSLLRPSGTAPKSSSDLQMIRKIKQTRLQNDLEETRNAIKEQKRQETIASTVRRFSTNKNTSTNSKQKNIYRAVPVKRYRDSNGKTIQPYMFNSNR